MPIENRNLEAGTRLAAKYKGQTYGAEVIQTKEGLRYRLEDGREFKSPSSAASAVMGGMAANGWRFWSLAGGLRRTRPASGRKEEADENEAYRWLGEPPLERTRSRRACPSSGNG